MQLNKALRGAFLIIIKDIYFWALGHSWPAWNELRPQWLPYSSRWWGRIDGALLVTCLHCIPQILIMWWRRSLTHDSKATSAVVMKKKNLCSVMLTDQSRSGWPFRFLDLYYSFFIYLCWRLLKQNPVRLQQRGSGLPVMNSWWYSLLRVCRFFIETLQERTSKTSRCQKKKRFRIDSDIARWQWW